MPDLRDELGRLADFVGEPVGLDDLAATRRRRERRRRAAGLVGGLGVLVLGVLVAFQLSKGGIGARPGTDVPPPPVPPVATIWPENAIAAAAPVNARSPEEVQAALDGGEDNLRWRTDPEQVVRRFGRSVLGRDLQIDETTSTAHGLVITAWPCPPGDPSHDCTVADQKPLQIGLVQPATTGTGGVWSVASVMSEPLVIKGLSDHASTVAPGEEISFDTFLFEGPTDAHLGIVVSNGCNVVHATKNVTFDGRNTLRVPALGAADPSCAAEPMGFVYAYATDDTTLPSTDPLNEPTAIEHPWMTIVPITIGTDGAVSSSTPSPE